MDVPGGCACAGSDGRQQNHRRREITVGHHVMLGNKHRIEANVLGELCFTQNLGIQTRNLPTVGVVLSVDEHAELHACASSSAGRHSATSSHGATGWHGATSYCVPRRQ